MSYEFNSPIAVAKDVLKKHKVDSVPVDVEDICRQENIRVMYANFDDIEKITGRKISGAIQKHPERGCTILVNEKDIKTRARFTIAHELGHYFLHMDGSDNKVITSFRMDHSPAERQADTFAAELLMPEESVRKEYGNMVIPVSDSLAEIFNVSKQAMRFRLDRLELIYV